MNKIKEKELLDILEKFDKCRRFSNSYTPEHLKELLAEGCEDMKNLMLKYHFTDEDEEDNVKRLYKSQYHYLDI